MVAFLRYSIAAIGAGQWSWVCFTTHIGLVNRMAEREMAKYGTLAPFVAMSYEERRRRSLAERCRRGDMSICNLEALTKDVGT